MSVELRAEEITGTAGMRKEVVDGDLGSEVLIGIVGEVFSEWIGKPDFAGLHELKYGDGGEHLVHRAEAKTSVEFIGNFLFAVGQTVGGSEDGLAVLGDEDGAGKTIGCSGFFHFRTESGEGRVLTHARHGKFRGWRNGPQFQLLDAMRFGGLDFDGEASKLVRGPLFDNAR